MSVGVGLGFGLGVVGGIYDPWLVAPPNPAFKFASTSAERRFNPTAGESATWSLGASSAGSWSLVVKNGNGTALRTLTASGTNVTLSWDGRDESGVLQPDGAYPYTVDVTAADGTHATQATGTALVDRSFLASITNPTSGSVVSNVFTNGATSASVTGSASASNLSQWILDYGPGASPATWTSLASSTSPIASGTLATWATANDANGPYTLRLRVLDTSSSVATRLAPVTLGNFSITKPATYQINVTSGESVTFTSIVPFTLTQTVSLRNLAGQVAKTLTSGQRSAGTYNDTWNGSSDGAGPVPDGPYFWVATVSDPSHTATFDYSNQTVTLGYDSFYDNLSIPAYDPFKNQPLTTSYSSSTPGIVTVALSTRPRAFGYVPGSCADPLNFCLQDHEYQPSGTQSVVWGGVDNSGKYRSDVRQIGVYKAGGGFAKNAILTFGTKPSISSFALLPYLVSSGGSQNVDFDLALRPSVTSTVTITYLNQDSLSVLKTLTITGQGSGHVTRMWDTRGDDGTLVAIGSYLVTVTVSDSLGNVTKAQLMTRVEY